jgi:hypothetical protein
VYVIGGAANPNTRTIERAPIQDGVLGTFSQVSGIQMTAPARTALSCAVLGRYLYVFGGDTAMAGGSGISIERAEIEPDTFNLKPFEAVTTSTLLLERFEHHMLEIENGIFAIGGHSASNATPTNSMERATIR